MKQRDYTVALVVPLVVVAIFAHPAYDWMHGLSLDVQFWLRNWSSPPHLESTQSPSVVVAIDEKTYRTEPFAGVPRVFWTREMADVIDALLDGGAAVIGFDLILSTSVEPFIKGYDRNLRIVLKKAAGQNKVVLGSTTLGQHPDGTCRHGFDVKTGSHTDLQRDAGDGVVVVSLSHQYVVVLSQHRVLTENLRTFCLDFASSFNHQVRVVVEHSLTGESQGTQ